MKTPFLLLSLLFLFSCANEEAPINAPAIEVDSSESSYTGTAPEAPVLSGVRAYGQKLLDETVEPLDNAQTKQCLDSMLSADLATRDFFFPVYLIITQKSEGVLGETASEHALAYFEKFPKEALDHYKGLDKDEKKVFTDDLAFEFYASGGDIPFDVNECIDGIQKRCNECAPDTKLLEDIGLELIKKANKMKAG